MLDWDKLAAEWLTKPAWTEVTTTDESADMLLSTFDGLDEYSCTLPTGTVIHKRWRRDDGQRWWMGEYAEHEDPEKVRIIWRAIRVKAVPEQEHSLATHQHVDACRTVKALHP